MKLGTTDTNPGQKQYGHIEMEGYAGPLRVRFPLIVAAGVAEGPLMAILAAQHGREINGIEVLRRLLCQLEPESMKGTVAAVPVANPLAVPMWQQDYPTEWPRYLSKSSRTPTCNLNRHWPGRPDGDLHDQMCHALMESLIQKADCVMDLHGWTDNSLGMAWASPRHRDLLNAFAMHVSMIKDEESVAGRRGYLEDACEDLGIAWLVAELTPQNRLSEPSVCQGLRGVTNVLKHLGVLEGDLDLPRERLFVTPTSVEHKFVAEHPGLLTPDLPIGTTVRKGERVGAITCLETLQPLQELISPADGLLFNLGVEVCEALNPTFIVAPGQVVGLVKEIAERLWCQAGVRIR